MVSKSTELRALDIVKNNGVRLAKDSSTGHFHFIVQGRNGEYDVYNTSGNWSCCAATNKRPNGKVRYDKDEDGKTYSKVWGCVMRVDKDKSVPFCSHTLAASIYFEELKKQLKAVV